MSKVSYDELFLCLYYQRLTKHIKTKSDDLEAEVNNDIMLKFKEIIKQNKQQNKKWDY